MLILDNDVRKALDIGNMMVVIKKTNWILRTRPFPSDDEDSIPQEKDTTTPHAINEEASQRMCSCPCRRNVIAVAIRKRLENIPGEYLLDCFKEIEEVLNKYERD